jgi:hypothetical protein
VDGFSSLFHFDVDMDVALMCTMDMEQSPVATTFSLLNISAYAYWVGQWYNENLLFFIFIKFQNFNKIKLKK